MRQPPTYLLALCALLCAQACGGDDSGSSSAEYVDALVAERDTQIEIACDCFDELGFDTPSACQNAQDPIGPSMRDCAKDAFADDENASITYLSCVQPLEENFSECLDDRLECSTIDTNLGPCGQDYGVGAQQCIELPASVRRELENCGVSLGLTLNLGPGTTAGDTGGGGNAGGGGGGTAGCNDTCVFAGDGECDDGGPGAQFVECDLGTDCTDCGPR
jgi:hypothetical protein